MYRTCAFCNSRLGGDGGPSGLGVGRRFAFDEARGRVWVICRSCARWNLTPLDDRLERLEALARAAQTGVVRASSPQVSLIRCGTYDIVRVGQPGRPELAEWRYGERLRARDRERARIVVPLTIAAVGLGIAANVAAGGSLGILVWNFGRIGNGLYISSVGWRRVTLSEPPICAACGSVMQLRARHLRNGRLVQEPHAALALVVECPVCHHEGALLTGADAAHALRRGLTYVNAQRSVGRGAGTAAREVDRHGGPEGLIRDVARRDLTLRQLRPDRRLALEIAVDEVAELAELERQWREAEDLATIADGVLSTTPQVEEQLAQLKKQRGADQPNS